MKLNELPILLVGSSGIIGSHLYDYLNDDYNVIPISRKNIKNQKKFLKIELTDDKDIKRQLKMIPDSFILIFLVGLAHSKGTKKDMKSFELTNCQTLINLLTILKENSKSPTKIIFSSTISVYGEQLDNTIYHENCELKPKSPYAITKMRAEKFLLTNFSEKVWILRLSPVYSKIFLLNINRRTKIFNFFFTVGKGNNRLSLCNINNISYTIDKIIKNFVPIGVYNISDEKAYSFSYLARIMTDKNIFKIPKWVINIIFNFGNYFGNTYISENSIKLLSDNIYPANKLMNYIKIPYQFKNNV